jgi:hypothetical protein
MAFPKISAQNGPLNPFRSINFTDFNINLLNIRPGYFDFKDRSDSEF